MTDQTSTRNEGESKKRRRKAALGVLLVVLIVILFATLLGGGKAPAPRTSHVTTATTTTPVTPTTLPVTTTTQKPRAKEKVPTKSTARAIVQGMKLTGFSYNVTTIGYGYIAPPGTVTFAAPTGTPVRGVVILCKSIVSATGSGYCYPKNVLAWAPGTYRYEVEYRGAVGFPFEASNTFETFTIAAKPHTVSTTTTLPTTTTSVPPTTTTTSTTLPSPVRSQYNVPSAPQSPEAAFVGGTGLPTSVGVSWTPPVNDGGAPIALYSVTDSQGDSCTTTVDSCTFTDTAAGSPEFVAITATNVAGTGPAANTTALLYANVGLSTTFGTNNLVVDEVSADTNSGASTASPLPTGTFTVVGYPPGTQFSQQTLMSMYGGSGVGDPSSLPNDGEIICTLTNADFTPAPADLPQIEATSNCTIPPSLMALGSGFVLEYSGDSVYAPSIDAAPWYEPVTFTTDETNPGAFDVESPSGQGLVGTVTFTDIGTGRVICTDANVGTGPGFCPLDLSELPNPVPEGDDGIVATFDPMVGFAGGPFLDELPTTPAYSFLSYTWPSMQASQYELQCPTGGPLTMTPSCPGPVDLTNSTVSIDQTSLPADGASYATVTVTIDDADGNPVPDVSLVFDNMANYADSSAQGNVGSGAPGDWIGPSGGWGVNAQSNSSGVATFEVRDSVAETVPLAVIVEQDTNLLDPDSYTTLWSGSITFTPTT